MRNSRWNKWSLRTYPFIFARFRHGAVWCIDKMTMLRIKVADHVRGRFNYVNKCQFVYHEKTWQENRVRVTGKKTLMLLCWNKRLNFAENYALQNCHSLMYWHVSLGKDNKKTTVTFLFFCGSCHQNCSNSNPVWSDLFNTT